MPECDAYIGLLTSYVDRWSEWIETVMAIRDVFLG